MFRNPLKTQSPRRWHDKCERHTYVDNPPSMDSGRCQRAADDRPEHRRANTRQQAQEASDNG
jgi:hypothetical protein